MIFKKKCRHKSFYKLKKYYVDVMEGPWTPRARGNDIKKIFCHKFFYKLRKYYVDVIEGP